MGPGRGGEPSWLRERCVAMRSFATLGALALLALALAPTASAEAGTDIVDANTDLKSWVRYVVGWTTCAADPVCDPEPFLSGPGGYVVAYILCAAHPTCDPEPLLGGSQYAASADTHAAPGCNIGLHLDCEAPCARVYSQGHIVWLNPPRVQFDSEECRAGNVALDALRDSISAM